MKIETTKRILNIVINELSKSEVHQEFNHPSISIRP
jgi:hypothetical protein